MPTFGLIVEGVFDEEALSALIQRIKGQAVEVVCRVCGGRVKGRFVRRLRELQYFHLEKTIVVSDTHGRNPQTLLNELQSEIQSQTYPFPVTFAIAAEELEAWLLSDPQAINRVCIQRGIPQSFSQLTQSPEQFPDPKKALEVMLGKAGVPYTKAIAREIVNQADLSQAEYWCQSFRGFKHAVEDC